MTSNNDTAQAVAKLDDPCTATSNQIQSPFFRLPPELRTMIYKTCLSVRSKKRRNPDVISLISLDDAQHYSWYGRSFSVSYLNPLAQSCRLAYQESSTLLYEQNHFIFESDRCLRKFIGSLQPIHIRSIQKLSVEYIARLFPFSGWTRPWWPRIHPETLDLLRLSDLSNLKFLHLEEHRVHLTERELVPRQPDTKKLMRDLVKMSRTLESLQTIVVRSQRRMQLMPHYMSVLFDFDDISGWVYSCSFVPSTPLGYSANLTETLQRVHRPLQPKHRG